MSNDETDFNPISELELAALSQLATMDADAMLQTVIDLWNGIKDRAARSVARAVVTGHGGDAAEIKAVMVVALRATAFADIIDKMRQDPEMLDLIEPDPDAVETTYQELLARHEVLQSEGMTRQ
jgi:hypothetical protein